MLWVGLLYFVMPCYIMLRHVVFHVLCRYVELWFVVLCGGMCVLSVVIMYVYIYIYM